MVAIAIKRVVMRVVSGFATEMPVQHGDWIQLGAAPAGIVREVRTAAVELETRNGTLLWLPSKLLDRLRPISVPLVDRCQLHTTLGIIAAPADAAELVRRGVAEALWSCCDYCESDLVVRLDHRDAGEIRIDVVASFAPAAYRGYRRWRRVVVRELEYEAARLGAPFRADGPPRFDCRQTARLG